MSTQHEHADRSRYDVVVVGGCGHVGLPLAIGFADRGLDVGIFDVNAEAVKIVESGALPFQENGAEEVLQRILEAGRLTVTTDASIISEADAVVVVIGTPVDEHLNPNPHAVTKALAETTHHFRDGQLLVLRSTVYPGVTQGVERMFAQHGVQLDVAFCPERIAEGKAMEELFTLPQIVSGRTQEIRDRAALLFGHLTDSIVELEPEEAELAKLFTNTWRYIKFAAANQFYMMANDHGLDFDRIRKALARDYPRAADMPGAGLAAGPCLFKDTMQLAAFTDNSFVLGHSAMLVNEGLPLYLVSHLEKKHDLSELTVGILGMAFKGESDDIRSSLSYKLKRILEFRAKGVLTTDPYVTVDDSLVPLERVLAECDVLILAAPHKTYADLVTDKPVVDVWNFLGNGSTV
ncbi:nucleotide sugar dehydrogenase [Nocardioides carbamazepini]|uniref:nucleotide sugar dehydrogenase n=1 Tax=Nocardioides carbamazepini TaxID=2854259 RepID=UPI00214A2CE9|nr:nucleotide sugar dehydrogenase [Nocardioides carbamazepini]MCR1782661.1 nucleotide sugar dehydrogenase [Nocardioides carbamazepini]